MTNWSKRNAPARPCKPWLSGWRLPAIQCQRRRQETQRTAVVNSTGGTAVVNVHGYDPAAAAIAQNQAAAQNEVMIASAVENGQRNLAVLETSVIKDDTLLPGESYGGQLQFDPPAGRGSKNFVIIVQIGNDTHQVNVSQAAPDRG